MDDKYFLPISGQQKVPTAVATRMFLDSKAHQQKLRFACSRHRFFSKRQSIALPLALLASTLTSVVSQEGEGVERYLWILRAQIHALWVTFTGDEKWELLQRKLFSLCPLSPPFHSLCSYALTKLISMPKSHHFPQGL